MVDADTAGYSFAPVQLCVHVRRSQSRGLMTTAVTLRVGNRLDVSGETAMGQIKHCSMISTEEVGENLSLARKDYKSRPDWALYAHSKVMFTGYGYWDKMNYY